MAKGQVTTWASDILSTCIGGPLHVLYWEQSVFTAEDGWFTTTVTGLAGLGVLGVAASCSWEWLCCLFGADGEVAITAINNPIVRTERIGLPRLWHSILSHRTLSPKHRFNPKFVHLVNQHDNVVAKHLTERLVDHRN